MTTDTTKPTLTIERVFHATPERLWTFWTDPKKYAKWLNPSGIDLVIHEWDLRPGGKIRFDMPQPDGNKHPQEGVFHTLTPHTHLVTGDADKTFLLDVRFEPVDAKRTRVRVTATGVPAEWHAPATIGWNAGFDQLQRGLAESEGGFTLERTFKAAPEKVWTLWTTKEGIEKWWVPSMREHAGFDMRVRSMDVRVGGGFAFEMSNKERSLVNRGTYTRVHPHDALGWTWHFDIFLAPGDKPYDVPILVTFAKTPTGGTRMRFTQGPLATPEFSEGSRQGVMANLAAMAKALGE